MWKKLMALLCIFCLLFVITGCAEQSDIESEEEAIEELTDVNEDITELTEDLQEISEGFGSDEES